MAQPLDDTHPVAARIMSELYRDMPPARKLQRVRELSLATAALALEGLRARHPEASDSELLLRLARIRLGEDLVAEAFGASSPIE